MLEDADLTKKEVYEAVEIETVGGVITKLISRNTVIPTKRS